MSSPRITDYSSMEWFGSLRWQHRWIEYMVGWWIGHFGKPQYVCDFGAGDGWWPHTFKQAGAKDCFAVELHEIAREYIPQNVYFLCHDLQQPLNLESRFDLSICLEVAEHLPANSADTLALNLVRHTGNLLLFSAAPPGQNGDGHINLQTPEYWRQRLTREGVQFSAVKTGEVRDAFKRILPPDYGFLAKNAMVFARVKQ